MFFMRLFKLKSQIGFMILFQVLSLHAQEEEPEQPVSFTTVSEAILRVFPEAYIDFLTISFMQLSDVIYPHQAEFLVPDKYFKKKINQKILDERAAILLEQLELAPACQSISAGEPQDYSWSAWEDKKVRKVSLIFGIGC